MYCLLNLQMALTDCGSQYVKATTLRCLSSKAVPATLMLAARPDFFDSDPIIAEWTPAAEAAAPDAPCRHLTMEDVSALVDHLHISWVELEALAISKAPPALQRKRRPTQPQLGRHCVCHEWRALSKAPPALQRKRRPTQPPISRRFELVFVMSDELILCMTEPPERAANALMGSFTVHAGTHRSTGRPNMTVYG